MTDDQNKQISHSDNNNDKTPLDPSADAQDFMGDTPGRTGITVNNSPNQPSAIPSHNKNDYAAGENANSPSSIPISTTMSQAKYDEAMEQSELGDTKPGAGLGSAPHTTEPTDELSNSGHSASEEDAGGSGSDPENDDDTQKTAQNMGIATNESTEQDNPQELDVGSDMDKAEEYHKTH